MTAIAKSAKTHPAAKKCCGWEEPATCIRGLTRYLIFTQALLSVKVFQLFAILSCKFMAI